MAVHGRCSHVHPDVVVVHCHDIGVGDDGDIWWPFIVVVAVTSLCK